MPGPEKRFRIRYHPADKREDIQALPKAAGERIRKRSEIVLGITHRKKVYQDLGACMGFSDRLLDKEGIRKTKNILVIPN